MSFFHGAETRIVDVGLRPIRQTQIGVIGLVGTSPQYLVAEGNRSLNQPVQVLNKRQAVDFFGVDREGYTIPNALNAIFDQVDSSGGVIVIVVNVLDLATHTTEVVEASKTFSSSDTIQLEEGISDLVVTNVGGLTTYDVTDDYTFNSQTGLITRVASGDITAGATVEVSYSFVDPSVVTNSDVIGATVDGDRTGLQAFIDSFNLFGFFPKILIAPEFSTAVAVTSALNQIAETIDVMAVVDAPLDSSYNEVISGRGPSGTINFNFASNRLVGCYPHLRAFRQATGAVENEPMSTRFAGVWANKIVSRGFWWSPSNTEFKGIVGTEKAVEFIPGNLDTEANNLNANGIVTYINAFGNGIRSWGNRSFAFPTITSPDNFLNIRFAQIVINERIRFFAQQYVDYPINNGLIDAILDSINAYFRSLINQGGLLDGSRVYYDPVDNPPQQIADGQIVFRVEMLPSPPAERITFLSYLNVNLANSLNVGRQPVGA